MIIFHFFLTCLLIIAWILDNEKFNKKSKTTYLVIFISLLLLAYFFFLFYFHS